MSKLVESVAKISAPKVFKAQTALICLAFVSGHLVAQPQVSTLYWHTCVLTTDDTVRCWGSGNRGTLGYGNEDDIGDDEVPRRAGDVNVGADVLQVSSGGSHNCVLTTGNTVRCWGIGSNGQLGYGNTDDVGDNELPSSVGEVSIGADVLQVSAGQSHNCVVTTGNAVRCWGHGVYGKLGYGNLNNIGDNELPSSAGDVNVGADVLQVSAGGGHTCVVTTGNTVRCWGSGLSGQHGYASRQKIGDDETPADSGDVNVGADVLHVSAGGNHTCVLTTANKVRCWGGAAFGQLGYGNTDGIGNDEVPATAGDVNVGVDVLQVSAGVQHTCVVTTGNAVRCWGDGSYGKLGYGNLDNIGDNELPSSVGDVNVGVDVLQVAAGYHHTCVVTIENMVRCWGLSGSHGHPNTGNIGDDEAPASAGDVHVFGDPLLPVELAAFDVQVEVDRARLSWSTASETNNAGFEVHHLLERSGQTLWDVVGFVEGSGSTSIPKEYSLEIDGLEPGRHRFRLKQVDFDGTFEFSPELEAVVDVPGSHFLIDAYPNPFNPRSYFSVAVPVDQFVSVALHDATGRRVRTLFEGDLRANEQHWVTIDGDGLASGVYVYRIEGQNFKESRTVTLQK